MAEFFRACAFITPMMATAFPDHSPMGQRVHGGQYAPALYQTLWAGMAVNSYLPATVIPPGAVEEGLPIGVQIVGRNSAI